MGGPLTLSTHGRSLRNGHWRRPTRDRSRAGASSAVSPAERRARMRETVAALRRFDGADLHTPVVMAVSGPKSQALALEVADAVTFVLAPEDDRVETTNRVRDFPGGATSNSPSTSPLSVTVSLRSWRRPTSTPQRFARPTRSSYFRVTPRQLPKKSNDVARRSASPISSSAPTLPTHSRRSWPSWPDNRRRHASQVNQATAIASPLPNGSSSATAKPVRTSDGSATSVFRPSRGSSTPVPALGEGH